MAGSMSKFEFPDCMHAMAAAFHMQHVDPGCVTISLPRTKWWELLNAIDRKYQAGILRFDGRGPMTDRFQYMGFTFAVEPERKAEAA
jgi:hypothetical protein